MTHQPSTSSGAPHADSSNPGSGSQPCGVTAGFDYVTGSNASNLALFRNIQAGPYWYGTEYAPDQDSAWFLYTAFSGGFQTYVSKRPPLFAVAVRVGEVPEPTTYALMLIGLGAVALARRRAR